MKPYSQEDIDRARAIATEPRSNDIYPYARIAESPIPYLTVIECIKRSYGWNEGDWCQWIECAMQAAVDKSDGKRTLDR